MGLDLIESKMACELEEERVKHFFLFLVLNRDDILVWFLK